MSPGLLRDGSVGKGTCYQARGPEFNAWDPPSLLKAQTKCCRLSFDLHMRAMTCVYVSMQTHTRTHDWCKKQLKRNWVLTFKQKSEANCVTWRNLADLQPDDLRRESSELTILILWYRKCLFSQPGWSALFLRKRKLKCCQFSGSGVYRLFLLLGIFLTVIQWMPTSFQRARWDCVPKDRQG